MTLPSLENRQKCPKCGHGPMTLRWCDLYRTVMSSVGDPCRLCPQKPTQAQSEEEREHMHAICPVCRYEMITATMDAR